MEIKINVMLDMTPRLESLAQMAITALGGRCDGKGMELTGDGQKREEAAPEGVPEPVCAVIPPSAAVPVQTQPITAPVQNEAPEIQQPAHKAPETAPEAQETPQPDPAAPVTELSVPDDETMRTMMDIAISKWAGVGSENSKDPQVLRDRKDVCNAFKQIARHLGAEKPTRLQGEARDRFLHEIEVNLYRVGDKIEWRAF